jgi:hypothetical protein
MAELPGRLARGQVTTADWQQEKPVEPIPIYSALARRTDMTLRRIAAIVLIGTSLLLGSCGGHGGSSSSAAPPSNNWDSMIWDQGNWG